MPEISAFLFHHNFYPKLRIDFKDAKISQERQQKLQLLKQEYDDIVSKHKNIIGLTHLGE